MSSFSESSRQSKKVAIASAGIVLSATVFALFISAFSVAPNAIHNCLSESSAESEAVSTMVMFVMGWSVCYVMKNHHCFAENMSSVISSCSAFARVSCSSTMAWLTLAGRHRRAAASRIYYGIKGHACIIFVSVLCLSCIIGLFASAFSMAPLTEEDVNEDIPSTESSQTMKAFTAGWIFVLSLKLRHELAGHLGYSCLLQPF
jgi:hypothetical protein